MNTIIRSARLAEQRVTLTSRHRHNQLLAESIQQPELDSEMSSIAIESQAETSTAEEETQYRPAIPDLPPESVMPSVADITAQLERATQEARDSGYAEGYEVGQSTATAEFSQRLEAMDRLLISMQQALDGGIGGVEDLQVEIVFAAVAKILGNTMVQEEGVIMAVKEVIHQVKDKRRLVVRVSPEDFALLERNKEKLTTGFDDRIELLSDDRVLLGGCLLETPGGNLDGRLEIQVQQLRDTLLSVRNRRTEVNTEIL